MATSQDISSENLTARPPVSVIILAQDEKDNIAQCIASCAWCDDVHVLDSGSTDGTQEIARAAGVQVHHNPFKSFGQQRNWAIDNIPTKHRWHFHLDADERFTPEMLSEMLAEIGPQGTNSRHAAYLVPSKLIFMNKWLKHSAGYPTYQVRLFHADRCRFIDVGHGQREQTSGTVAKLRFPYLHYNFSKGLLEWLYKHNRYSDRESAEGLEMQKSFPFSLDKLIHSDGTTRRRTLKAMSFRLKARALWRFLYMYFFRFGWLDATAGFHYCAMIAMYEYWIELKMREKRFSWLDKTRQQVANLLAGASQTAQPLVEVLIPTKNEADHITEAVQNALLLGPVYVLDSLSTDGTQDLARAAGATVVEHKFINYSDQKNWGLDNIPFKAKWIFILDADERITPQLQEEINRVVSSPDAAEGYFVNRLLIFMGQKVRHGGLYPSWNLRLFQRGKARYEDRVVHEHMVVDGRTAYLKEEMLHIRRESINRYMDKHIVYANLESDEWVRLKLGRSTTAPARQLFSKWRGIRHWLRREVWPVTPLRPFWRFLYMFIWKRGFLDGRPGWHLARLMSCYEYMISLLYREKIAKALDVRRKNAGTSKP